MQTILSEFLAAGLLPIGEDDEKLEHLEKASVDLSNKVSERPTLFQRFALVGLDDSVPASDPIHKLANEFLRQQWQTIANKIGPDPVQVHRAVLLRAVEIAGESEPNLRAAITYISRNLPNGTVKGSTQGAVTALLSRLSHTTAEEISAAWVNQTEVVLPKITSKPKKSQVSKEELVQGLARAVGPQDRDGKPLPTPNPHWPQQGQPWANEFVPRATDAIHAAIQTGTRAFAEDLQDAVKEALQGLVTNVERLAIRDAKAELLWLRMSLYSPFKRMSYLQMDEATLALSVALDVSRIVAPSAPESVEFFVGSLVRAVRDPAIDLEKTCREVAVLFGGEPEAKGFDSGGIEALGRRGLIDVLLRPSPAPFHDQVGAIDQKPNVSAFAVRLFRELQIAKLLQPRK